MSGFPGQHMKKMGSVADEELNYILSFFGQFDLHKNDLLIKQHREVKDGKAIENWVQMDNAAIVQQLGMVPQPA
ncbi:MAG: hypothetical protein K0Q79_3621 [Flavipsychrobacter sp.]|jgi:hypothetical protein|nr:hypothetical protein [Flavipsychrobacter sp.]